MDEDWTKLIEYSIGSISITGCFFIIFVFLCFKNLRSFPFESVVYLTISSMMTTFSYLFYYINPNTPKSELNMTMCEIQAFSIIWFENSQYIWAALIGYGVYQAVVNFEDNNYKTDWRKRTKYLLTGFGLPLVISCICLSRSVFGPSGSWCWIDTKYDQNLEKNLFLSFLYGFVWTLILINVFYTVRVIIFLNNNFNTREEREITKVYIWKLLRYPIIQICCLLPGTVNRLLHFFNVENTPLEFLQVLFVALQGFIYAIAYGYNPQVRNTLVNTFRVFCNCLCCKQPIKRDSDSSGAASRRLYDRSNNLSETNTSF